MLSCPQHVTMDGPLPIVRLRCHHHCPAFSATPGEALAPSMARPLGSWRVVSGKGLAYLAVTRVMPFNHHSVRSLGGGARPSPGQERGPFPSPLGFLAAVAPRPSQAQSRERGEGTRRARAPAGSSRPRGPHSGLPQGQLSAWSC